jgi:predicted dehydrogenase
VVAMSNYVIRISIIGAGIFVKDTYIPNIEANRHRIKLTAILSRSAQSIDEVSQLLSDGGEGVQRFVGPEGEEEFFLRAKEVCDAAIVVVPIPLLGKYVERCLRSGLHVLSEKPVAMTSDEAGSLIERYRGGIEVTNGIQLEKGIMWHVAENYRLEPAVQYAADFVKNHHLRPKSFALTALRQQSVTSKYAVTTWRATPQYKGSYVLDGGIHFIALLRTIMGKESTVSNIISTYEERSVVEVATCGSCRVGEALGTFHIRYGALPLVVCRLDVYWDDVILTITQFKGIGYEVAITGQETRIFPFGGLEAEFSLWLDTFTTGQPAPELSPEEALADLFVVEAMCNS